MPLPININELLHGGSVEWERVEFREGWNPERTLKTICAFANDFNNWGGGYIILGVAENNGEPVFPPMGLTINLIDRIQLELLQYCKRIQPNYFPIVEPVDFEGKKLLILWCFGGSNRPYKAPDSLGQNSRYFYYLRRFASTVQPSTEEERELLSMASNIPFDDQINQNRQLSDFDLSEIKIFLNEVGSDLENEIPNLPISEIARRMNIAEGANEFLLPKNVGLLFFDKNLQQVFPSAMIEFVIFYDETGTDYNEKIFQGPIQKQLKSALNFLKDQIIIERVIKQPGKSESKRFFNYPYEALEEALCNAVYHRGYDEDSPIEVRIYPSRIDIISFPGPLPPLDKEKLKIRMFDVRKYRNRRIGEFLKELHLTEGRATGIPTIVKALKNNGSPEPAFETDDARTYFKSTIFLHHLFNLSDERVQVSVQVREQVNLFIISNLDEILSSYSLFGEQVREQVNAQVRAMIPDAKIKLLVRILSLCLNDRKAKEIFEELGISNQTKNFNNYILPLISGEMIERTIPDKPRSRGQMYRTSEKAKLLIQLIVSK